MGASVCCPFADKHGLQSSEVTLALDGASKACTLRIIAINDVYQLDNFPQLKTLVAEESKGCRNVVTTLAGDFLAPSLLSSLDAGHGMIRLLNDIPVNYVCFGNHEADIPYKQLVHRIEEFNGIFLNSNMPDFEPTLPSSHILLLDGDDMNPAARKVAFTGFCVGGGKFKATYREGAFGGAAATMIPVLDAAKAVVAELGAKHAQLDAIIPLTHQDMAEDIELARLFSFPVILAGHDHDIIIEEHHGCQVVKAGMDCIQAAIIDVTWGADACDTTPSVTVTLKKVADYEKNESLEAKIHKLNAPVRELENAMLYELEKDAKPLTSEKAKYGDVSMATLVATAIRNSLACDCAVINSGAVRGNKDYKLCRGISYGDLKKECPYPSPMVVVPMPFSVINEGIKLSRKPWWDIPEGSSPQEATSALQVDDRMALTDHEVELICEDDPDIGRMYDVAVDTRVLKKNAIFARYCSEYPDRIPPDDAGRPVLPILVEFFCTQMWEKLINVAMNSSIVATKSLMSNQGSAEAILEKKIDRLFMLWDADNNGFVETEELGDAVKECLGDLLSSGIIIEQMIAMIDENGDGMVSVEELQAGIKKIHFTNHMH